MGIKQAPNNAAVIYSYLRLFEYLIHYGNRDRVHQQTDFSNSLNEREP